MQLPKDVSGNAIRAAVRTGAIRIQGAAKRNLTANGSVITGTLRRSITKRIGSDRDGFTADIGTNVEYAPFVEYGTRPRAKHPGSMAKPYLRPAFDSEKDEAIKDIGDALDDIVRNFGL